SPEDRMDTARWQTVKQVFHEALDQPESARSRFVITMCQDDQQLRAEVEALLAAHREAGAFLESPTGEASPMERESAPEVFERLQRTLAGRYSLEREIGRGGM